MPPALLAVSTTVSVPIEPTAVYVAMAVAALLVLIPAFDSLTRIINFFRAKPPLHKVYATKEEVLDVEKRLTRLVRDDGADLDKLEQRVADSRGEMEGRITTQITEVKETQNSMGKELRSVGNQLSEVIGQLRSIGHRRAT